MVHKNQTNTDPLTQGVQGLKGAEGINQLQAQCARTNQAQAHSAQEPNNVANISLQCARTKQAHAHSAQEPNNLARSA